MPSSSERNRLRQRGVHTSTRAQLDKLRRGTGRPALEELEAQAVEEERREAYIAGLHREREAAMVDLDRLRQLRPESREWAPGDRLDKGEPRSAAERVAAAEGRLAGIDAEIKRGEG